MKRNVLISITTLLGVIIFVGCAQVLSTNTTISDLVLMGLKMNSKVDITYEIKSDLPDDHFVKMGSLKGTTNANSVFNQMIDEYIQNKFVNIGSGDIKIVITLNSLVMEQKMEHFTYNFLKGMSSNGAEGSAFGRVKCSIVITKNNEELRTKNIVASTEENYNTTDNSSMNKIYGDLMNKSFNKVLLIINSYLESVDL